MRFVLTLCASHPQPPLSFARTGLGSGFQGWCGASGDTHKDGHQLTGGLQASPGA